MLNPYPDNDGPKSYSKRSDPQGYQQKRAWPISGQGSEMKSERKIRESMNRQAAQDRRNPIENDRRRQEPESRDMIYNSFTDSYHGAGQSEKKDPPPHSLDEQYRQKFRALEHERGTPRTRRVQFSEELELKKQRPQTPTTPTIPILRTGIRARRATPGRNAKENIADPRDPTPRSSKKTSNAGHYQEPIGLTSHLASSDPPIDRSKAPLFSPAAKPRRERVERREKAPRPLDTRRDVESQNNLRSIEPSATPPLRPFQHPPTPDRWDVAHLFSKGNGNSTPRGMHSSNQSLDSSLPSQYDHSLRAYAPRSDHWDAPDLYPDTWRFGTASPSNASEESQSAYLINKYTKNARTSILELSRKGGLPSLMSPGGSSLPAPTPKGGENQGRGFHSEPRPRPTDGDLAQTKKNQQGYSQLDDDGGSEQEENFGTELVLLPSIPKQIEINSNEDASVSVFEKPKTRRNRFGGMLKRQAELPVVELTYEPYKVPFQELPVVALSYDENADLKQSTDDTDDSDSGLYYNAKASKWDESKTGEHENDHLFSSHKTAAQKKRRLVIMLVLLVLSCLAVGLPSYFKMVKDTSSNPSEVFEESECVNGHSDETEFSERYSTIRKYLMATTSVEVLNIDDVASPQRKALCWLADFDKRQVGINKGNIPALAQRYILAVIYYSLVDEDSDDTTSLSKTDFLSSSHECDWSVTMCSIPEIVTALLLADKVLTGMLPAEVGNLEHLAFLELSLNRLTGTIPPSIAQLTKLEYFAIAFNAFTGSVPSQLGAMTKLEFLNMRSSQLHGTIPAELGRLTKLETLLLEGNWLSGTIPSSLGNLHKAQQMSFRKNYLSGGVANELCELREGRLTELKVDSWIDCDCWGIDRVLHTMSLLMDQRMPTTRNNPRAQTSTFSLQSLHQGCSLINMCLRLVEEISGSETMMEFNGGPY